MFCGIKKYNNLNIFRVIIVNRQKKFVTYIFASNCNDDIKKILQNYEKGKNITVNNKKILKDFYGEDNLKYLLNIKTKDFKYIFESIYFNDSINTIKKKIFVFIGNTQKLLIDKNQELWIVTKDSKKIFLSNIYSELNITPSIYNKIEPDYKKFINKNGNSILSEQVENLSDYTLFDLANNYEFNNDIYCHNLLDELEYLKEKKYKISTVIINGYILKYWPNAIVNEDYSAYVKDYNNIKKKLKKDVKIIDFTNSIKIDNSLFNQCSIIQVLVHIKNSYTIDFVDLLKIFRFFNVNEKTPFMRYKDLDWPAPGYLVYKPLIDNEYISEKQLLEWVSKYKKNKDTDYKEIRYSIRGLTLKRFLYDSELGPKYSTINIHKNGNIEIRLAFKESAKINLKNVYDALIDIKSLINEINTIDYRLERKIPKSYKLNTPDVEFNELTNNLIFKNDTKLILIDSMIEFKYPSEINYKNLNDFANSFYPFISPIFSKKNYYDKMFIAKFKRVSNYSKMSELFEFIHKTIIQSPNILDKTVIQLLMNNFNKTLDESIKIFRDFQRKFGYMGISNTKNFRQVGIELKLLNNKIHIKGSKTIMQLTNANSFILRMLTLFINKSKYSKSKNFKNILDVSKININEDEENDETLVNNINNDETLNKYNSLYNIDNALGNIYNNSNYKNYLEDEDEIDADEINKIDYDDEDKDDIDFINNKKVKIVNNKQNYLANNKNIDQTIKMTCDDQVSDKDVCADFCEDEFYVLRRLQKYDNPVFRFKSDPKFKNYARRCASPVERQPLVLKDNPDENKNIDRRAYSYAVKMGSSPDRQNYYICPKAWCPIEEIPIYYEDIKDSLVERPTRKGVCITAKCPSCAKKGLTTWLRVVDDSKYHEYPGFLDPSDHPNNLCMPCCFKKPTNVKTSKKYNLYQKCTGQTIDEENNSEEIDYVMGQDKMPLSKNRLGILPTLLSKLFKSYSETGYLKEKSIHLLRRGVKNDEKQSFLQCICSIIERNIPITKSILKNYLINQKLTDTLYKTLKNGELYTIFNINKNSSIVNFKNWLNSNNEIINHEYLWDFLSRKDILFPEGLNIFIITSRSILCPVGENPNNFFDLSKKSIFLYKYGNYYEPLVKVQNINGELIYKKLFNALDSEVTQIYSMYNNNCVSKPILSWNNLMKDVVGESKYYHLKDNVDNKNLYKIINKDINIVGQYVDYYNKSIGFLNKDGFLLPFNPVGSLNKLTVFDKIEKKSIKETYDFYYSISQKYKLPYKPIRVFKNNDKMIALLLECNFVIPIKDFKGQFPLLEANGKYYLDADEYINKGDREYDERLRIVHYILFLNETYELMRFELSRLLQQKKNKEILLQVINSNKKLKEKRVLVNKVINNHLQSIVSITEKLNFDINKYKKPSIRIIAEEKKVVECISPHYSYKNGKCKLVVLKKSPYNSYDTYDLFINKITEELLRNNFLRDEILDDKIPDIIDKKEVTQGDDEFLLGLTKIDNIATIKSLYKKKKKLIVNNSDMFSTVQPKYFGFNKDKYILSEDVIKKDSSNLKYLPNHWNKIFEKKYKYYDEPIQINTLYVSLLRILNEIGSDVKTVNDLKNLQIQKIESLTKSNINSNKSFKNMNKDILDPIVRIITIYKNINKLIYKKINTLSNLKDYILTNEYPANIVDIFILSYALNLNIIILDKRITKSNPDGFTSFIKSINNDYIFLFERKIINKTIYSPIYFNNTYIRKRKDIKDVFLKNKINKVNNQNNSIKVKIKKK